MGMATKGGGCVASGPRNKVIKEKSKTTGPVMMNKGGMANSKKKGFPDLNKDGKVTQADVLKGRGVQKKMRGGEMKMARGGDVQKKMRGGMMKMARGGMSSKKKMRG